MYPFRVRKNNYSVIEKLNNIGVDWKDCDEFIETECMASRKKKMRKLSDAFVSMPGGFGTLDEFSEILLLMQEGKMPKMPMFLIGKSFWKPLDRYFGTKMQRLKTINGDDRKIYRITDNIDEVVSAANKIGHPLIYENIYDRSHRYGHR